MEERCAEFGHTPNRDNWRLVGPMHIAESMEQAREDVKFGLGDWLHYFREVAALPLATEANSGDEVDVLNATGFAVIGTPDDAIAQLERLQKQSGGFGAFLFMANDWADRDAQLRSYELFARHVMPHFTGSTRSTTDSTRWAAQNRPEFIGKAGEAIMKAIGDHHAEKQAKQEAAKG
jgi:limonene 1,2-monooxygenase